MSKKILIISASPRKGGNSDILCDRFMQGAEEAGNTVEKVFLRDLKIGYCMACYGCRETKKCVQKDDMAAFQEQLMASDMAVFVTPLYYFGFSAQLKTVIDRFYSINGQLTAKGLKTALLVAAWDSNDWTMRDIQAHYETLCRYLNFQNQGEILGVGCGTVEITKRTRFPQEAYALGQRLRG